MTSSTESHYARGMLISPESCCQIYIDNVKEMCCAKVSDIKNTNEVMERLGLEENVVEVVNRSGGGWVMCRKGMLMNL